jgi:hypothetical protein
MRSSFPTPWLLGLGLCAAAFALGGCSARDRSDSAAARATAAATAKPQAGISGAGSAAQGQCGCNEDGTKLPGQQCNEPTPGAGSEAAGTDCGERPLSGPVPDEVTERRDSAGRTVQHIGTEFTDAPAMTVTEALASAEQVAGKPLQLEGYVSAMCEGRRAWFAIVGRDQTGDTLRVLTVPAFLVPLGVVGKQVRVEGTIASTELSAQTAKHLSDSHKLPTTNAPGEAGTQLVMNATVAEFF